MGKPKAKPASQKVVRQRREATPSVESEYEVSWLVGETNEEAKTVNGQWVPEDRLVKSFGRKALVKTLKKPKRKNLFRVRLANKGS